MSPQAQRVAIAEACGWVRVPNKKAWCQHHLCLGPHVKLAELPDYLSDLNAMHGSEKVLNDAQKYHYRNYAMQAVATPFVSETEDCIFTMVHATASHRAEAFLRTLGKWTD